MNLGPRLKMDPGIGLQNSIAPSLGWLQLFTTEYRMSNLNEIHENIQNQIKTIEKKINSTDRAIDKIDDKINEFKINDRKDGRKKGKRGPPNNNDLHIRDAEFRHNYFKYKEGALKVAGSEGSIYKDVLARLRDYISKNELFLQGGTIRCNDFIRVYCDSETVSFFKLAAALRRVLQ
jgi:hypothetical protein